MNTDISLFCNAHDLKQPKQHYIILKVYDTKIDFRNRKIKISSKIILVDRFVPIVTVYERKEWIYRSYTA